MENGLLDCEQYLEEAMAEHATAQCPPLLAQALNYAVFPGGARVRPKICKAVALANNSSDVGLANAAASAIELLHCAYWFMTTFPASMMRLSAEENPPFMQNLASALPFSPVMPSLLPHFKP